jgi:HTH-type transcriptional regulator / antitoxin HigA
METLTNIKTTRATAARNSARFSRNAYLKTIRAALPIPPETEADNERLIGIMLEIDDRAESGGVSPEEKVFSELLAIVVQDFEERKYPLPSLPPHELRRVAMEQRGLAHKDLAALVGNKGLTSEILAGRRRVSPAIADFGGAACAGRCAVIEKRPERVTSCPLRPTEL